MSSEWIAFLAGLGIGIVMTCVWVIWLFTTEEPTNDR
jgi:hypothetical protein